MKVIKLTYPFDEIFLIKIDDVSIDKKLLANLTKKFQPYTLIFSTPHDIEPCVIALVYTYVLEDIKYDSKISNISLKALLYLTKSKQISDAIESSRNFNGLAIVSINKQGIIDALKEIGYEIDNIEEETYNCKNLDGLTDITAYRLNELNL
ncbi:hypothetical protein Calag_0749 [Caldisphaera lagunensis DSM 15908]|uniref:Uncharacterized protein n=1 Tax=Caldisphaera lagunensis (strain DSM 15908 / JCM 11604 / ANMR 0165 / IC-154) TaxID=1056495 RepID=L0A9B7_CALLD|nr:hypothetical protein [Caldisphaera lagunensis]AFZ70493.1 hypothetical protein Calag_0749 [Caldisphaera lagunensis DSM 15908]